MSDKKDYLGDGVYADFDGHHVILEAGPNIIYLEGPVIDALNRYVDRLAEEAARKHEGASDG